MEEHVAAVAESLESVLESAHRALLDLEGVAVRMEGPVILIRRRMSWRSLAPRAASGAVVLYFALSLLSTHVPGPTHWFGPGRALAADARLVERSDAAVDTFLTYHAPKPIRGISLPLAPHVQSQPAAGLSAPAWAPLAGGDPARQARPRAAVAGHAKMAPGPVH